jgi:HEAT repeat protein
VRGFTVAACLLVTLSPCHLVTLSWARAESPVAEDERTLHEAGLPADGPSLLAFFHARARTGIDPDRVRVLARQFAADVSAERDAAMVELLGLGPLALPIVRQAANDLDHPEAAARASRCLPWLEGPASSQLLAVAARLMGQHRPDGAAAALLAYLPCADDRDVMEAVNMALAAVAATDGKADPAILSALSDPVAVRRAAAGVALCRADPPDHLTAVRRLLTDSSPGARLRAALALAEAGDAESVPVLIDLLLELPREERQRVEEVLTRLAGEWTPILNYRSEDDIGRRIRRDAWAAWWHATDGRSLLAVVRRHTLHAEDRLVVRGLLGKLGDEDFTAREAASSELLALGRITLPQLHEATKDADLEVARRARLLTEQIERQKPVPAAALRLLAVRKPAGAVEALLAYLPHAEDETRAEEVAKSLSVLARRDGELNPALVRALTDPGPDIRTTAADALASGGGAAGRAEVRKLLVDASPSVRLRAALALARKKERDSVPVLIDLLTLLPADQVSRAEDALHQLAGDTAPQAFAGEKPEERRKCRDAWAAWWKANAASVDLGRLTAPTLLGYTVVCDLVGRCVYEIDRHGKRRWTIRNVEGPVDAWVLPGDRVLIAEFYGNRITERNLKGDIVWQKQVRGNPINVQRLPNGHTFVATANGPILDLDREGKETTTIARPGGVLGAYRLRTGVIVAITRNGRCLLLNAEGKQLGSFAAGNTGNASGRLDLLANGHILITQTQRNKVVEFDSAGTKIREWDTPGVSTASALPNGRILVASQTSQRVYELDRAGKVVWEHKNAGQVFRARQR